MQQVIHIHQAAPDKPQVGQTCNGCGVCCAAEPCPVSLTLLWPHAKPCRALEWSEKNHRYFCGMVKQPEAYLTWLPRRLQSLASHIFKRWIAADQRCDSTAEIL